MRVHAPYATKYQRGYLQEALEVDGANDRQPLFTPVIDRDVHPLFLGQIGAVEPDALHTVIADQAGLHLRRQTPAAGLWLRREGDRSRTHNWTAFPAKRGGQ